MYFSSVDSADPNNASVDSSDLDGPCYDSPPLKIMRLTVKDLKTRSWDRRLREACVFLGFATGAKSLQVEPVRPSAQPNPATRTRIDIADGYKLPDAPSDIVHPNSTDVERFSCTSPWLVIIIQLLSGEIIDRSSIWIYPFKHLVVYQEQFKQFVTLLEEVDLDSLKARDMLQILTTTISQIVSSSGPKQPDYEYSYTNVERIMGEYADWFPKHHKKVQQSLPHADNEKEEEKEGKPAAEAFTERPERAQLGGFGLDNTDTGGGCNKSREDLEQKHVDHTCTCLRDARDHLKLVIDVIDGDLVGLMKLRQAISDGSVRKIRFKDLWNLFSPGDLVVTSKRPHQAFRVIFVSGGRPLMTTSTIYNEDKTRADFQYENEGSKVSPFKLDCVRFDFDGEKYGPIQEEININHFDEEKDVVELQVYPIRFADDESKLRQNLVKRAQHFTTYREFKHKWYAGLSLSGHEEVS